MIVKYSGKQSLPHTESVPRCTLEQTASSLIFEKDKAFLPKSLSTSSIDSQAQPHARQTKEREKITIRWNVTIQT